MKAFVQYSKFALLLLISAVLLSSFFNIEKNKANAVRFPYKQAGLTKQQAAAFLLNRFTYGATPGQVDEVVKMGLESWFQQQLQANLADDSLNKRLEEYDAINLSNTEALAKYPPGFVVVHFALMDSAICKDSVDKAIDKKGYNDQIQGYMKQKGFKSDQELYKQFISQNILRAAYTNNQLQEVLTDFWFNHFNVSFSKGECAQFIPAYERDVIRPNVFGNFDKLLLATAKSPAMLYFLDNFTSQGAASPPAPAQNMMMMGGNMMGANDTSKPKVVPKPQPKNTAGLNENYAREVMELHTLGVDGGYTQSDVTQAARVLTGWTIYPISSYGFGSSMKGLVDKIGVKNLEQKGFVRDSDFLFTPTRHDNGEKNILGKHFDANGGYQEGIDFLEMLAHHPSTAKFISRKLAVRFVGDNPPQSLIDKMAKTFTDQNGNIAQVLVTMVNSPEFWSTKTLNDKTKSPFELAISACRSVNANITQPYQLFNWITRMGQKIFYYQAPTGFPDRAQYWINTGALLNRMNFGLALATQKIPGVTVNLKALNNQHEPESAEAALLTYSKIMMPENNEEAILKQVAPLLNQPDLAKKVSDAASKSTPTPVVTPPPVNAFSGMDAMSGGEQLNENEKRKEAAKLNNTPLKAADPNNNMTAQAVGILIGSPAFQRR